MQYTSRALDSLQSAVHFEQKEYIELLFALHRSGTLHLVIYRTVIKRRAGRVTQADSY